MLTGPVVYLFRVASLPNNPAIGSERRRLAELRRLPKTFADLLNKKLCRIWLATPAQIREHKRRREVSQHIELVSKRVPVL